MKFFSVFLCQRCREILREILVKFSVLRFPEFGCATKNFTKISRRKRREKRKISRKFHSAGAHRCLIAKHAPNLTQFLLLKLKISRGFVVLLVAPFGEGLSEHV